MIFLRKFIRKRERNWPVSELMLKEKPKELHNQLKEARAGSMPMEYNKINSHTSA